VSERRPPVADEETKADEKPEDEKEEDTGEEDETAGDKDTADEDTGEEEDGGEEETVDEFKDLLSYAASFGYDEDAARAFGSPENLRTALAGLDGKLAGMGRKLMEADKEDEDEDEEEEPRRARKAKPAKKRGGKRRGRDEDEDEFEPEFGEDVDPDVAKAVKGMHEHYRERLEESRSEIAELKKQQGDLTGYVREQEARAFRTRMDSLFGALAEEWHEVFGEEPGYKLGVKSEQYVNRTKVLDTMEAIARGLETTGQEVPDEGDLLQRAIAVDFGKHQKAMTRKALSKSAKKRAGQITNRPTQRKASAKTGRDAAVARQKQLDKRLDAADED
jgi:hypothetical protein